MEALVAVGLASNVVQFVDFTSKLIHAYSRLRHGAAQSEYEYHRTITNHLLPIVDKVKSSAQCIAQSSTALTPEQKALQLIADGCCELADKLIERLDAYIVQYGKDGARALLPRAKIAFKILWEKSEVDEMIKQLERFSKALHLHLTLEVYQTQKSQALQLAKDDDVKAVLSRTSQLESSLENLRLGIDETENNVLRAVCDLAVDNSKLHARASRESVFNQTVLSTSMDNLRQVVQTSHVESMNSLAQVAVENSRFFASMTTERESLEQVIGNVLRPLMEEYKDSLLQETRKEFRGTARAHMEELLAVLTQNIDLSDFSQNSKYDKQPYYRTARSHDTTSQIQAYGDNNEDETRKNRDFKSNLALIYQKTYLKETQIGKFWLLITQTVQFQPNQPPLAVYNLEAHFMPFMHWLSTSYSIMYRKTDDGRGPPTFGFQFPVYRILDYDHEAVDAILQGDISAIQEMLSEKRIFPSDRTDNGMTLLHWAAHCNQVEISRALILSGADVNAQDVCEWTPIALSSMKMDSIWLHDTFAPFYLLEDYIELLKPIKWGGRTVISWSPKDSLFVESGTLPFDSRGYEIHVHILDATLHQTPGYEALERDGGIPVARYAASLCWRLGGESYSNCSGIPADNSYSPEDFVIYRGYYVERNVALKCLQLVERVISTGIKRRPDCIFDSFYGRRIYDYFEFVGYRSLWDQILEEHGIDPDWAWHESERRKRVVTGDTSAHEVSIGVDVSQITNVTKRKAFISREGD
ncbi:hypothetical protein F5Y12DRAFT_322043 [Xylaria sp. FL1777]|nr:hypothetical protein F5Y12DRAFT_322043 [Xylaria sp. FL1777]